MRVVDAALLLEPVPERPATGGDLHEPRVDDDPLQHVVGIDGEHVGNRVGDDLRVAREPLVRRDHRSVPALARNAGEMPGVTRVAEHEVGDRERRLLDHALRVLIRVFERCDGPIGFRLRIVLEREARGLVVAGVRIVGEGRERARLHRRGRGQVGRQLADGTGARRRR